MSKPSSVSVSVRLSTVDHAALMSEAERLNTNISEVLRRSWRKFNDAQKVEQQLLMLEQRLTKAIGETAFAACNLNTEEQADCKQQLAAMGVKW
jgi:Lon protease-like protein